jgi:hypothetical protein
VAALPLLRHYRWARWGQPTPPELRPALCLVAEVLGEPLSPWRSLAEALDALLDQMASE